MRMRVERGEVVVVGDDVGRGGLGGGGLRGQNLVDDRGGGGLTRVHSRV